MNAGHLKEQQELFTHTSFQPFILLAFFFFLFEKTCYLPWPQTADAPASST